MEHPLSTKHRFVELRVRGETLDRISAQLNVARSTLQRWQAEYASDIARLRRSPWEDFAADTGFTPERELPRLNRSITAAEDTLASRLGRMVTLRLLRFHRAASEEYERLRSILFNREHRLARHKIGACADFLPMRPRCTNHLQQIVFQSADFPNPPSPTFSLSHLQPC